MLEEQKKFLSRYLNSKGDFYGTLNSLNLETEHFLSWRESVEFDLAYRGAMRKIQELLRHENYMMSLQVCNKILTEGGQIEEKFEQIHNIDNDGVSTFSAKRTTINKGVPGWVIKASLTENNLIKAINELSTEGVLPSSISKKLLATSERLTSDFQSVFDGDNKSETISNEKAVALIKQAILGAKNS